MGILRIRDLKVRARIGVSHRERSKAQDLLINMVLTYDSAKACASDDLKDALDYRPLAKKTIRIIRCSGYFLLEKLACRLIEEIQKDRRIRRVFIRIDKTVMKGGVSGVSFEMDSKNKRRTVE